MRLIGAVFAAIVVVVATGCGGESLGDTAGGASPRESPDGSASSLSPRPSVPTERGSSSTTSKLANREIVNVAFDSVEISSDRRSISVSAGATPLGFCFAADEGLSVETIDGSLVISVRRSVQIQQASTTCVPLCEGPVVSTAVLDEALPEQVDWARAPTDAVETCVSRRNGNELLPIEQR